MSNSNNIKVLNQNYTMREFKDTFSKLPVVARRIIELDIRRFLFLLEKTMAEAPESQIDLAAKNRALIVTEINLPFVKKLLECDEAARVFLERLQNEHDKSRIQLANFDHKGNITLH